MNPVVSDPGGAPRVLNEDGYLTIAITKHSGMSYLVQSADAPDSPRFSAASTTVLLNNGTTLKVRDNLPVATSLNRFLCVKVTAAP
jgi:hypothetical protein